MPALVRREGMRRKGRLFDFGGSVGYIRVSVCVRVCNVCVQGPVGWISLSVNWS